MLNVNAELEQIRTARSRLQKFRIKLLRPSVAALESGSADLAAALECLKRVEPALVSRGKRSVALEQALHVEVAGLRRELQQVNALLEGAADFYQGWSRLLGCAGGEGAVNYTAHGTAGPPISIDSKNVVMHG